MTIYGGTLFKVAQTATIRTEGKFHAIGTAQSPIVFQGNNGAWWNGITAKTGDFSTTYGDIRLEHVTFSNTTKPLHIETPITAVVQNAVLNSPSIGIEILPNYNYAVDPPAPPPTMQLNAVTISGAGTYGITVENFSDLHVDGCVISGNQGNTGIALTNSSPKILETIVHDFEVGILGVANSAPLLFDQGIGGYNTFTDNMIAAQFDGSSNAAMGIDDGIGGQNSFTGYQTYAVILNDNSVVHSEWNWNDTPSPTSGIFSVNSGSKLYWEPYLTSPPGGSAPVSGGDVKDNEGDDPRLTPGDSRMQQVLQLRVRERNREAAALLRTIIADRTAPTQFKRWALGHLLAVSQKLSAPNLASYLVGLQSTMPEVRQHLAELLPSAYVHERGVSNARSQYENNIRNHGNSITEAQALYGKFSYALFGVGDRAEAQAVLSRLQSRFARSGQARLAEAQFNATSSSSFASNGVSGKNKALNEVGSLQRGQTMPTAFTLHQNYPNPFNPTTTINFGLPEPAHVSLVVYDVLGRTVAELANELYEAGYQSVTWNASSVSSGVYFARFTATDINGTSRLNKVSKLLLAK
jgi:hypothetical protein